MAIWSVSIAILTLVLLIYNHPLPTMQKYLPQWFWQIPSRDGSEDTGPVVDGDHEPKSRREAGPDVEISIEEPSEAETTPKASASRTYSTVPSLSLDSDGQDKKETTPDSKNSPPPSFPAANSAQRASAMLQPPRSVSNDQVASSLMPPPAKPTPISRGLQPGQAPSLRAPTTGPLPNRGPPASSQQRVSGSLAPAATVSSSDSRGKVLLKPGHSPMDWAALTRSSSSRLSGVDTFQRVTPSQLRKMTGRKGKPAWSSWQGKVYNITPYVDFHPGGGPEIMKCAGRDGEKLFMEIHPWVNWENMLGACLVGVMVPEGYHDAKGKEVESELEGLD